MKHRTLKRLSASALAACMCLSLLPGAMAAESAAGVTATHTEVEYPDLRQVTRSVYGFLTQQAVKIPADGGSKLQVKLIPAGETQEVTYTTDTVYTQRNSMTGTDYADLLVAECTKGALCEVLLDESGRVLGVHQVLDSNTQVSRGSEITVVAFDTAQYGGDLTAPGGNSGRMVAQGWIYGMDYTGGKGTITVGDGNHQTYVFEEQYAVNEQTKVYLVDDGYCSEASTLQEVKANYITKADANGDIYSTKERYIAVCVFADDYKTDYRDSCVEELYIYKTPSIQDENYMFVPDDAPNHSDYRENNDALNKNYMPETHPELTSAEPFCLMENRLYWIGDDEVTVLLMVDEYAPGQYDLTVMDLGWPSSGYQYMRNIEKLGFDPRDVKTLYLTHGHVDHYGAAWDFVEMNQRAGVEMAVYESLEDTLGYVNFTDDNGEPWDIDGALTSTTERYCITDFFPEHEWFDVSADGSIQMYSYLNTGHSTGCLSFVIRVVADGEDAYFDAGDVVEFSYMGGYGALGSLSKGYLRNAFEYSLRYIQSYIVPMMEAESDYIYCIPQHTNHYPILEVWKANGKINEGKSADDAGYVPLMACMEEGPDAIINQLEKRQATQVYDSYFQAWASDPKPIGYASDPLDPDTKVTGSSATYQTNDAYGPFKREAGTYEIQILTDTSNETGAILHGYDAWLNPSPYFEGLTNLDSEDLGEGFVIEKDAYVHDPDGWYVQLCVHVKDGYTGNINTGDPEIPSGPVESLQGDGWFEIIRTERLDSKEEAEALLAQLQSGATYTVTLDKSSEIQLADNLSDTFQKVSGKTFTDVPDTHWASEAVRFVTDLGLFQGTSDTTFSPEMPMTRAMLVSILYRQAGSPEAGASGFADVPANAWYADAVAWASANGIVAGTGSGFEPDASLTRETLAAILYRAAGAQAGADALGAYADANAVSTWARDAMNWAVTQGLIAGKTGSRLDPSGTASRAEAAAILMHYIQNSSL